MDDAFAAGSLIGACETALLRLEATGGDPPHVFGETGEVLFWLYATGDTGRGDLLSPGFQWARNQYAHGNLITEAVEYHYGATLGHFVLGASRLGAPPVYRWTPREHIGTYPKAHDRPDLAADYRHSNSPETRRRHILGRIVRASRERQSSRSRAGRGLATGPRDRCQDP